MPRRESFYDVIDAAIEDVTINGFDSGERIEFWRNRIREAMGKALPSQSHLQDILRESMIRTYRRLIERGEIVKYHSGISRFTLQKVRPHMRAELDRRIMAAANLIKLNRETAITKTLQRFTGWSTSIPAGGSRVVKKRDTKMEIRKALTSQPFEERRVLIDQGHKLTASLNNILAVDGKAIALKWHSHWRQAGYNYRPDHKERDEHIYMMRDNWAQRDGLVKVGADGYYDEITSVAEEPFCRCYAEYIYNIRSMPKDMVTKKGVEALAEARAKIAATMRKAA